MTYLRTTSTLINVFGIKISEEWDEKEKITRYHPKKTTTILGFINWSKMYMSPLIRDEDIEYYLSGRKWTGEEILDHLSIRYIIDDLFVHDVYLQEEFADKPWKQKKHYLHIFQK